MPQRTVIAQVAGAVFGGTSSPGFFYIQATTALILVLAANTAFNGFPLLGSILARDRNLPSQLNNRGDRLAYSNGILALAVVAGLLIFIYQANVTKLIQLYIIGVFTSFTLGQTGMVRHWNRQLRTERDPRERTRIRRSRVINAFGGSLCGVVLVIVVITKFTKGAYLVLIAMPILFMIMQAINKHYARVADELSTEDTGLVMPSRNHVIVLVSKVHKPTLRALAFARATRPDSLTALTVNVDDEATRALQADWERHDLPVPLTVVESPYREITRPVLRYIKQMRKQRPRDIVSVFIPEYVVGHWWEQLLHNQSALRLKSRLLFQAGVMVTSVPWQMDSSAAAAKRPFRPDGPAAPMRGGAVRTAQGDAREPAAGPHARERRPVGRRRRHGRHPVAAWLTARAAVRCSGARWSCGSVRRPTAAAASPGTPTPTAGWSSSGTRCPARPSARWSPRTAAAASAAPTRSRCSSPRRTGSSRRARTPARGGAAAATGSTRRGRRSGS